MSSNNHSGIHLFMGFIMYPELYIKDRRSTLQKTNILRIIITKQLQNRIYCSEFRFSEKF
jgi:hypothetical protein